MVAYAQFAVACCKTAFAEFIRRATESPALPNSGAGGNKYANDGDDRRGQTADVNGYEDPAVRKGVLKIGVSA